MNPSAHHALLSSQPFWAPSFASLPIQHADVYRDWPGFLVFMASEVKRHVSSQGSNQRLAIDWARTKVGGIGIYTSEEVFFRAGRYPLIMELQA